ncbi:MAG: hypothetical protein V1808_01580 [Candidatus Daviesbacteria bacterium]
MVTEIDSISQHLEMVEDAVKDFKARFGIEAVIGISGGSNVKDELASAIILDLLCGLKDRKIAILSGGTDSGVAKVATTIAREFNLPTVGVFPREGKKYVLLDILDLAIESLPPSYGRAGWGTETPTYVELLNGMAVIEGEFGTLVEVGTVLSTNKKRIKDSKSIIYLCPIEGTGKTADIVRILPIVEVQGYYLPSYCLPEEKVDNGIDAARFFRRKLFES